MTVFVANTNVIDLTGLKNEITDAFINDAAVTVTIKTVAGVEVAGETWPVSMGYVAASNGNYRGILSDEIELVAKSKYIAHIDADGGPDLVGHWELTFKAAARTVADE